MTANVPGADWEPLPPEEWLVRLAVASKDAELGRANPVAFELSSRDEAEARPRLSVWAECITSHEQAWHLMGANQKYCFALRLKPSDIRSIRPEPKEPLSEPLDVVWYPLFIAIDGNKIPDQRPGAQGHAGISGLKAGSIPNKSQRKSLRSQLADLAKVIALPVREWKQAVADSSVN